MATDPAESQSEEARRLARLAPLFQKGWAKLHPLDERHHAQVEQAFAKVAQEKKGRSADVKETKANLNRMERERQKAKESEQAHSAPKGPQHSQ